MQSRNTEYVLGLFLLSSISLLCDSKKILLLPFSMYSHVQELVAIGEPLRAKGHDVYIIMNPNLPQFDSFKNKTKLGILTHHLPEPDWLELYGDGTEGADQLVESVLKMSFLEDLRTNCEPDVPGFLPVCTNILSDKLLTEKLRAMKFDLGIVDAFMITRCLYTLLYKLDVPYVSVGLQYEPWLWRAPALPSFVPFPLGTVYTEKMTFWERVKNTFYMLDWFSSPRVPYLDDRLVSEYAPEKPFVSLTQLAGKSLLWLLDTDVALDYARPTMPNVVDIGGLTTRPAQALSPDLEKWVSSAKHGVIVVSFGSYGANLPNEMREKFMRAFSNLNQKVIWRNLKDDPEKVPANVKLSTWLPQNDLLGHPNIKLFVTHSGSNGQFEALYHGVPMIGFSLFGDQMYNAIRMQSKGFGIAASLLDFTAESLTEDIKKIIKDKSFAENIKKASEIYRDRPNTPTERAVYWVEHVMKYGDQHLRSHGLDLPWYQYLMLDIIAAIFVIIHLTIWLVLRLCSFACKRRNSNKLKQN